MFVLFGLSPRLNDRGTVRLHCTDCGVTGPHRLAEKQNRISLFFIPLVPVSTSYVTTCGHCAMQHTLSASRAGELGLV